MRRTLNPEELDRALLVAMHPSSSGWALSGLPLRDLTVWEVVASRRRVPREARTALLAAALGGPWGVSGVRPGETPEAFRLRWALTVLKTTWLTGPRLKLLASDLASVAADSADEAVTAKVTVALAQHRNSDLVVVSAFLKHFYGRRYGLPGSAWDGALAALRKLPHPWPMLADLSELHLHSSVLRNGGAELLRQTTLLHAATALEGIDEVSGQVLLRMLPGWSKSCFRDLVTIAREVGDNPDPAATAEQFDERPAADDLARALQHASAEDTHPEQLKRLPLKYLNVWTAQVPERVDGGRCPRRPDGRAAQDAVRPSSRRARPDVRPARGGGRWGLGDALGVRRADSDVDDRGALGAYRAQHRLSGCVRT
jgi:hypothetical protein